MITTQHSMVAGTCMDQNATCLLRLPDLAWQFGFDEKTNTEPKLPYKEMQCTGGSRRGAVETSNNTQINSWRHANAIFSAASTRLDAPEQTTPITVKLPPRIPQVSSTLHSLTTQATENPVVDTALLLMRTSAVQVSSRPVRC